MRKWLPVGVVALVATIILLAATHDVSHVPSAEDAAAARAVLKEARQERRGSDFRAEVRFIASVQQRILAAAPINKGIPFGQARELSDVLRLGYGLCYDRSRAIETVLRSAGFEVRHASIYAVSERGSSIAALATPGVRSHALTEVRTSRGWMLVDSNSLWLGLTKAGEPIELKELAGVDREDLTYEPNRIFAGPFTYVYGLYSRHGKFYPPYDAVPDVNWSEFRQNFID